MYADDAIVYASAASKDEIVPGLKVYYDNISNWYRINKLHIDKREV